MEDQEDIIIGLTNRNLQCIVEDILSLTDGPTISSCFLVCKLWNNALTDCEIWRRLIERKCINSKSFRNLCQTNGWKKWLPILGGTVQNHSVYKTIHYRLSSVSPPVDEAGIVCRKLYTGYIFSCLKIHRGFLFAGMVDGVIKMWDLGALAKHVRPLRMLVGHEERVTGLDAQGAYLISSSVDQSVRVWNAITGGQLRILRGVGAPIINIKVTLDRIITYSKNGNFNLWFWNNPNNIEFLYNISAVNYEHLNEVVMGDEYLVIAVLNKIQNEKQRLQIFSSRTGRKLSDKKLFCDGDLVCMSITQSLLCLGFSTDFELLNLDTSTKITRLSLANGPTTDRYMKNICLTDSLLLVMTTSGRIKLWSLPDIFCKSSPLPILEIQNSQSSWQNIAFNQNKLAFGLEMKLGDIKVYQLDAKFESPSTEFANQTSNLCYNQHFEELFSCYQISQHLRPDLK